MLVKRVKRLGEFFINVLGERNFEVNVGLLINQVGYEINDGFEMVKILNLFFKIIFSDRNERENINNRG